MQKTADRSNKHTNQIISVTYICIQLPTSNLGNDLVTELLLKSALSCLLQIEQFYATCLISTSLPISLHIFRYFFIFLDQLHLKRASFTMQKGIFYRVKVHLLSPVYESLLQPFLCPFPFHNERVSLPLHYYNNTIKTTTSQFSCHSRHSSPHHNTLTTRNLREMLKVTATKNKNYVRVLE